MTRRRSRAHNAQIQGHSRRPCRRSHRVTGVRIVACYLPSKSPWLNAIEPKWVHGKRAVVEPARPLSAQELADRVCAYFPGYDPPLAQVAALAGALHAG